MTLWHLELLRMVRTHRWVILVGVYGLFGILGPVTGRYMTEILGNFAGEITIEMPDPRPLDGIAQFVSNATQLGLLAIVIVAASALAIDAREEVAAFLRTRVEHARSLLLPRYVAVTLAAIGALVIGTVIAWGLTTVLLGALPAEAMVLGTVFGALYLAFAVAVVAAAGAFVRGMLPTVFVGLGLLLVLPLIGIVPALQHWLPSHLVGAVVALLDGTATSEYLRAAGVTIVATPVLLALAALRLERREL
jgi:ABC-2 type transport system permease protein